jgi:transcriptional regulator with XRE-family HTH domain
MTHKGVGGRVPRLLTEPPDGGGSSSEVSGGAPDDSAVWDDKAFVGRVRELARARGIPIAELMERAELSESWLRHFAAKGRQVDALLKLARVLDVDAAELMGLKPVSTAGTGRRAVQQLERMAVVAHLAAHVYVALDREASDSAADILAALREAIDWPDESARRRPAPRSP